MHRAPQLRLSLAVVQWVLVVAGMLFLCSAAWVWMGCALGLAAVGVSFIAVAVLTANAEVKT